MNLRDAIARSLGDYANPLSAIPTGVHELDALIGGLMEGITVIGATPGGGKTSLMCCLALYAATNPLVNSVALFSREQSTSATILYNFVPMVLEIDATCIRDREPSIELLAQKIDESGMPYLPIDIIEQADCPDKRMTVDFISDYVKQHKPSVVFIDYLQMLDASGSHFSREREIADMMAKLTDLAKSQHVPVVILAQLSREAEVMTEPPKKQDPERPFYAEPVMPEKKHLRESASIEHNAHTVILLWQRGAPMTKNPGARRITAIIAKARNGSSRAHNEYGFEYVDFAFYGSKKQFLEASRAEDHYNSIQRSIREFQPY